jgi:hypothetical protein
VGAIPFAHADLELWRNARSGIQYLDPATNFLVYGGVDDVWIDPKGNLMIVDYKATSKDKEVDLEAEWQKGYKRQMEVYQWLFRQNGFPVLPVGYFVYCNGKRDRAAFDAKLEFDIKIIPYEGKTEWIIPTLLKIKDCLMSDKIPPAGPECDFCTYRSAIQSLKSKSLV